MGDPVLKLVLVRGVTTVMLVELQVLLIIALEEVPAEDGLEEHLEQTELLDLEDLDIHHMVLVVEVALEKMKEEDLVMLESVE